MVTFIITYYNLPVQMLCECIDSILALSLRPYEREILVIDDGSDVSPMNDLLHYGNDIIYIRQRNGGLSEARNKGILSATGTYLQFIDADDRLVVNAYEHCLDIIRYQKDVDMVLFNTTSSTTADLDFTDSSPVSGTEYMRHNNIHASACGYLFSRSVLGDLRFTSGIVHEDEEFTPRLLLHAERVFPTKAKAYFYRQRPHSITTSTDEDNCTKRLDDTRDIIVRLQTFADRVSHNDALALQRRIAQLTMDYLYNTIMLTRSRQVLDQRIDELYQQGLFPLPDRKYSQKYIWFRRLTNSSMGRSILLRTLPLLKKER